MRARATIRAVRRELRGSRGRFAHLALSLAVGVAAVTGVASLVGAIESGIRAHSRRILGADLVIESRRPLPAELAGVLARVRGHERTDLVELPTMASGDGGRSQLVELRGVGGRFPLHGELRTDPPGRDAGALGADHALVAPDLLARLGVRVGERIRLGGADFEIAGVILEEPDRLDFSLALGPRVLIGIEGVERTGLVGFGSRVEHRALVRLDGDPGREALEALVARVRDGVPDGVHLDVDTHLDAEPGLRRALGKVDRTLGLAALVSLVLGGVGVAEVTRAWMDERTRPLAILRCLGARPRDVAAVAFAQIAILAAAGSALGAALGALVPFAVAAAAPDLVSPELLRFAPGPVARGFALGLVVALAFATPAILASWRVPPARVLRAEAEPLPAPRALRAGAFAVVGLATFAAAWERAGNPLEAAVFTVGLGAAALVLAAASFAIGHAARGLAAMPVPRFARALRGGLAALGRPGAGSLASIAGLGIGVGGLVGLLVVEDRVRRELASALPEDAPTVFLVDVQPDQWPRVEAILAEEGATRAEVAPFVTARLAAVDGRPVEELVRERGGEGRSEWVLTREQRLTWRDRLPASNALAAGSWWTAGEPAEVSLEERYAADLRAGVGTQVTFDVQGVPLDFVVSSLRTVAWESFAINFFWIAEPGPLDGAPSIRLASARVPAERETRLQDRLAEAFPNVTVLRVRPLLERLRAVFARLAVGVRLLGVFAALAGTAIVGGAVAAVTLRRRREVAILRALGASRARVVARLASEFATAGAVAGALGGVLGVALAAAVLRWVLDLPLDLRGSTVAFSTLGASLLAALAGLAASRGALRASPLEVLRAGG